MKVRLQNLWGRVRGSLWFIPAWMTLAGGILAWLAVGLDAIVAATEVPEPIPFLYPGDREGARTLLATVAGSMITVAGVTFSVTVVALSLASSQFGPRLLTNFMRDRGNQLVLGTFIATFLFCLIALGSGGRDPEAGPSVSASLGLLLAVTSLGVLIYFIHHVASSIRAERVIDGVARELERAVERLFPREDDGEENAVEIADPGPDPPGSARVGAGSSGYIQGVDEAALVAVAEAEDVVLRALKRPGHFVVEGEALVVVRGREDLAPELAERIRRAFLLGRQRTQEQDPEYGIHQLVEVAVRALSPGVNDPYTAVSCVDWLGAVLCRIASSPLRPPRRTGSDGRLRLIVDPLTFAGMLAAAFNQIRQCAQTMPAVSIRILETLATVAERTGEAERLAAVRAQGDMVFHGAIASGMQECDRQDVEARYRTLQETLERAASPAAA